MQQLHQERLNEIMGIMKDGQAMNAYTAASRMKWRLTYSNWDKFPRCKKWFAFSEARAHLEHLVVKGVLKKLERDGNVFFKRHSKGK